MQTVRFDLTSGAWTEILGGNTWIKFQVKTANRVRLYMNENATAPDIDADHFLVEAFQPGYDFEVDNVIANGRLWARADADPAIIVAFRKTSL